MEYFSKKVWSYHGSRVENKVVVLYLLRPLPRGRTALGDDLIFLMLHLDSLTAGRLSKCPRNVLFDVLWTDKMSLGFAVGDCCGFSELNHGFYDPPLGRTAGLLLLRKFIVLPPRWNCIDDMVDVYCSLVSEHSATAAEWTKHATCIDNTIHLLLAGGA